MAGRAPAPLAARIALAASLFFAGATLAADLGKATVYSRPGQRLSAEVEILALQAGDEKKLSARLASRQAYGKAGVPFNQALADVRVAIGRKAGRPVVRLTTTKPVNEPSLEALVELRSSTGTRSGRYTLWVDPQAYAAATAAKPGAANPKPAAKAALAATAGAAIAQAPTSRDELFGLPPEKPAASSRDELFGVAPAEGAKPSAESKPLQWRGYVQNTTAYDYQDPKHWSRAVFRTQLGTQGGSGDFKWKASARLDVDPVYFNSGFYPEDVRKDQRADFFLRETYIDTSLAGLQLRLGKQHIVWGEMVGFFFADVVPARDQRDFILPEFEQIRIPQWAARVEYFGKNSHAELIWLPYPEVDNIGKPGAEFYPFRIPTPGFTQQFNNDVGPTRNLKNSNLGGRVSTLISGWDMSAFFYRSTDVSPTFYQDVTLAPTPTLTFTPRHDRISQTGGTVAKDFGSVVGKAEAVYTTGRSFNVSRLSEPTGVVPQKTVEYVLGLDFTLPRETRLNVQYFDRVFLDHDPDLFFFDKHESGMSALLSGKIGGTVFPELLIIQSLNRNDRLARWKLGWSPEKDWRLTLGVDVFHGPPIGLFGRFNDRDRVYAEARFDF